MSFEYPKNVRFRCTRCPICCGDTENRERTILLLKIEAKRIAKKTLKPLNEFAEKINGSEPYVYCMKKTGDGKCVFLEGNSCAIYRTRPVICRFYPFQLNNNKGEYTFAFTNECPSIGKGPLLEKSYFENLFNEITKLMKEDTEQSGDEE
jgi:Fe-S-cluster containining protein